MISQQLFIQKIASKITSVQQGDLIAESNNTKVMFVPESIIKQFLTKEEFLTLILSENNSQRKSDLEVKVEKDANA